MFELSVQNVASYLETHPEIGPGPWRGKPLGGGVSNTVLLAESDSRRLVLKQSLARLRVEQEWLADQARIHREAASLRELGPRLTRGAVPEVVFEDRPNFIYAMEAAPEGATDWKALLLDGRGEERHAAAAAEILGGIIRVTLRIDSWRKKYADQHCFDQLRLDPYYRFTALRHPDLADQFEDRIEACQRNACALVHGDFSPKNLLVCGDRMTLIDFEVIHFGDPAFDVAFLLNHLLLKSAHGVDGAQRMGLCFWRALGLGWLEAEAIKHLGCLYLARVDGKSPAEYLTEEERKFVRGRARELILHPPKTLEEIFT